MLCLFVSCALCLKETNRLQGYTASLNDLKFTGTENTWHYGGGVHMEKSETTVSETRITNCEFNGCQNTDQEATTAAPKRGGGAIYVHWVTLECENCLFLNCKARRGKGGAIFADVGSAVSVNYGNFTGCQTVKVDADYGYRQNGGAIFISDKELRVDNSVFTRCEILSGDVFSAGGGAIHGETINCFNCSFTSCKASGIAATAKATANIKASPIFPP